MNVCIIKLCGYLRTFLGSCTCNVCKDDKILCKQIWKLDIDEMVEAGVAGTEDIEINPF